MKTKSIITLAAIAILSASSAAGAATVVNQTKPGDNVNGIAVIEQSDRQALLDDGSIIYNDGGIWYLNGQAVTIAHAVQAPHLDGTHEQPVTPHLDAPANIDRTQHLDAPSHEEPTTPHLDAPASIDRSSHLDGTHSEPATPHLDAPEHHETAPTQTSTTNTGNTATKPTTQTPAVNTKTEVKDDTKPTTTKNDTKTTTGAAVHKTSNTSPIVRNTPKTGQTSEKTVQGTTAKPVSTQTPKQAAVEKAAANQENGAKHTAAADKAAVKAAAAPVFTKDKLPTTGDKDILGQLLTGLGIVALVAAGLAVSYKLTSPRRYRHDD